MNRVFGVARDLTTSLSKKVRGQRQESRGQRQEIAQIRTEIGSKEQELDQIRNQLRATKDSTGRREYEKKKSRAQREISQLKNEFRAVTKKERAQKTGHKRKENSTKPENSTLDETKTTLEVPTFDDAVNQLQHFLAGQNISPELRWVFHEDVVYRNGRIIVKEPLPEGNSRTVELLYERGREQDSGIRLETLCLLGSRPCCYIWLPQDPPNDKHSLLLMSKFAMGVPIVLQPAQSVRNPLTWQLYKLFEGKADSAIPVERLPRRNPNDRL